MVTVQLPDRLSLLLLKEMVIFPHMAITIVVKNPQDIKLLTEIHDQHQLVGICNLRGSGSAPVTIEDIYPIGTACRVSIVGSAAVEQPEFTLQGIARISYLRLLDNRTPITALITPLQEASSAETTVLEMLKESSLALMKACFAAGKPLPEAALNLLDSVADPGRLADLITIYLNPEFSVQQKVLSLTNHLDRLKFVHRLLSSVHQQLHVKRGFGTGVEKELGKHQKEQLLRQQMKAIQQELGEDTNDLESLRQKIEQAEMMDSTREIILKEFNRLGKMNPSSPDYHITLTYLEYLVEMPWGRETVDNLDVAHAEQVLNEDHFGLEKVKDRILEYLAVCNLKKDLKGPILCLVGPPGVGKTSLGKSIARAMGRSFIRMSLGGMRDEAEIRGHRRTYVGAMPGKIIQELKRVKNRNPVFMLDEIDKLGKDFRGDPSSALLEVMDPEQNNSFTDHYLNLPFDLSKVLFITTANQLDPIPAPLRDRMEIITIPGYSEAEKKAIAFQYLVPRQLENNGLQDDRIMFTDEAMDTIITNYTREAGVRNLEKTIGKILRKLARRKAGGQQVEKAVTGRSVENFLGPREFHRELAAVRGKIGVVTGMAWTPTGGDIIFIEATKMKSSSPKLTLTGSLGEVMKESAITALSHLRSLEDSLGLDAELFASHDIHIHVPAGSIPKDGPSAGLTIFLALLSLFSNHPADHQTAITGEITLSGRVLPVGGIKEKVLAAHRAGIHCIVLPAENLKHLQDIPADVKEQMTFTGVDTVMAAIPLVIPGFTAAATTAPQIPATFL
ncbi:MAG: endopeptidase La [Deltaproteobacteria bacterium]|nr:endopeptidase La [Candidatus Anaeroferrophillus wilburensis]MBN2890144.1 endopeptidase La [Deltaproteobacteria bacterium]